MDNKIVSISSKKIADFFELNYFGRDIKIFHPTTEKKILNDSIFFITNLNKNKIAELKKFKNVYLLLSSKVDRSKINLDCPYSTCDNPRDTFFKIVEEFFFTKKSISKTFIHPTAHIGEDVKIGKNVYIDRDVFIEGPCTVGNGCHISSRCIILGKCDIGASTYLSTEVLIGEETLSLRKENKLFKNNKHVGGVIIGKNCRIGSRSFISKGTINDTTIKNNVILAEKVLIAHNVEIEKNTVVTVGSTVCGSAEIGENCWLGPNCLIMNHVKILSNIKIAAGSTLFSNAEKKGTYIGHPAKIIKIKDKKNES